MCRLIIFVLALINTFGAFGAVEPLDDNGSLASHNRCAHAMIDYYQAIPIINHLVSSGHLQFRRTKVAIIDEGLHVESGQFDNLRTVQFLDPPELLTDSRSHGTEVTSIIAADSNDGLINGIASRLLGDRLELVVGRAFFRGRDVSAADRARFPDIPLDVIPTLLTIERVEQAIAAGARIINLSLGTSTTDGSPIHNFVQHQRAWAEVIRNHRDVLFIAAAANHPFELTGGNDIPAGLDAANLITVGGTESCRPMERWVGGAYGNQIDIAAPSTVQAVVYETVTRTAQSLPVTGNSFATPMVTAVAAIVQSIEPTLNGAELKAFLLAPGNSYPTAPEVGGRRLSMVKPIVRAILDFTTPPASIIAELDSFGGGTDDFADPAGYIINRQFGSVMFTITALTGESMPYDSAPQEIAGHDIEFRPPGPIPSTDRYSKNLGFIMPGSASFSLGNRVDTATFVLLGEFELNVDYTTPIKLKSRLEATVGGSYRFGGDARRGEVRLAECEITSRALPLNWMTDIASRDSGADRFISIQVTGQADVVYEGSIATRPPQPATYRLQADFTTAFFIYVSNDALLNQLEQVCVGGIRGAHR